MKSWVIKEKYKPEINILSVLLNNRGVNEQERREFIEPPPITHYIKALPITFKASLKAVREEMIQAVADKKPIIIHGDYDADGICASAILYRTLTKALNYNKVACFIPNRFDQGYGLSKESITEAGKLLEKRFKEKSGLLVSVDCGITVEKEVIGLAKDLGFRLIITDHHQRKDKLPKADLVLWTDSTVGSGLALILSIVLGLRDEQALSLAGIATVTDLALLRGFNRALVKKALKVLNTNPPLGIKKLLEISGRSTGDVTTYDLGYIIGPRLNASGRLDSAYDSLKLLIEDNAEEIERTAKKLNATNLERQELTQKMYDLAEKVIETKSDKVHITVSSEFHEGIVGLIAGKLVQKYYKPAIAISINGDTAKGSARSVPGVNIVELLRKYEDRFINLGGHPLAAGFSILRKKLDVFISDFQTYTNSTILNELLIPKLEVDMEIPLSNVTIDFAKEVSSLKPYGIGNPEPLFLSRSVGVVGCDFVGKDKAHMSLKLIDGQDIYRAVFFDAKNSGVGGLDLGTKVDIVYAATLKEYKGKVSVDLVLKDFCTVS